MVTGTTPRYHTVSTIRCCDHSCKSSVELPRPIYHTTVRRPPALVATVFHAFSAPRVTYRSLAQYRSSCARDRDRNDMRLAT